jgi:hypothetical protein
VFLFYASKLGENPTHETDLNLHFEKNLSQHDYFMCSFGTNELALLKWRQKWQGKKTGKISRT